jgi:integrase
VKKPPARARERFLTPEERRKIFDNYGEKDSFRDFLFALEQTGCRPGEVSAVTAQHVDLRTGVWVLDAHKTRGKTGKPRVIILTPEMVEVTKRLMARHADSVCVRVALFDGLVWTPVRFRPFLCGDHQRFRPPDHRRSEESMWPTLNVRATRGVDQAVEPSASQITPDGGGSVGLKSQADVQVSLF